jgi:heme a synthase
LVKQRLIGILALCASFIAFCVIGLGAFTRLIDAGLGCPDWPGCYGYLTVPMAEQAVGYPDSPFVTYKAWAEMIHRYFAGTLSLLILAIIIVVVIEGIRKDRQSKHNILRNNIPRNNIPRNNIPKNNISRNNIPRNNISRNNIPNLILAACMIIAVIYQIVLGQLTVTLKLLPIIVTQHLLGGFLILSLLWLMYLNNKPDRVILNDVPLNGLMKYIIFAVIALLLLFCQIALGAWTSTNYASLSCPDFPFCINDHPFMVMQFRQAFDIFSPIGVNYDGGVLPQAIRQTIQMSHRLGALIVTLYMLIFTVFVVRKFKYCIYMMKSIYIIWGLLIIQLCIGMTNIIFKLPLVTAISHNLVAVLLLQAVLTLVYKLMIYRKKVF